MSEAATPMSEGGPPEHRMLTQSAGTLASQGLLLVFAAASSVVVARTLGPAGRGVLATAMMAPTFLAIPLALGAGIGNVYFLGRREVEPEVALGTSLALACLIAGVAMPMYVAVALPLRDGPLHHLGLPYILVGAVLIPFTLFQRYLAGTLQGLRRMALYNTVFVLQSCLIAVLYLTLLLGFGLGPLAALLSVLAATALSPIPAVARLRRAYGPWRRDRSYASRSIRFGIRGDLANVIGLLNYRLDVLLVTGFLNYAAVGTYAVAFTLAELLWQVPNAVATVLFPRIASGGGDLTAVTARSARLTLGLSVAGAVVAWLLAPILIPAIFSQRFASSVPAFRLLLPGVAMYTIAKILSADLAGRGRPGITSVAGMVSLVVTVPMDVLLIPRIGIRGAAIASSVAYTAGAAVLVAVFVRVARARVVDVLLPRWGDLTIVAGQARSEVRRGISALRARRR